MKTPPPLPGEKGYNEQRMTIHRPKSGRRGPLPNQPVLIVCEDAQCRYAAKPHGHYES